MTADDDPAIPDARIGCEARGGLSDYKNDVPESVIEVPPDYDPDDKLTASNSSAKPLAAHPWQCASLWGAAEIVLLNAVGKEVTYEEFMVYLGGYDDKDLPRFRDYLSDLQFDLEEFESTYDRNTSKWDDDNRSEIAWNFYRNLLPLLRSSDESEAEPDKLKKSQRLPPNYLHAIMPELAVKATEESKGRIQLKFDLDQQAQAAVVEERLAGEFTGLDSGAIADSPEVDSTAKTSTLSSADVQDPQKSTDQGTRKVSFNLNPVSKRRACIDHKLP